jgi:hypothetical protein
MPFIKLAGLRPKTAEQPGNYVYWGTNNLDSAALIWFNIIKIKQV